MRKVGLIVTALAVMAGTLALGLALATASAGGCATAQLQGRLVEADGTLAVEAVPGGQVTRVEWPFGYGVGEEAGTLTLTRLFLTVAREGDLVSMGGGEGGPGFRACGPVTLGLMVPPEEPRVGVGLTVTGTAYEPCIPPPSGCGYWVSVGTPDGATWRAPLEHDRSYESAVSGEPAPLTVGDGLPASLGPGGYDVVFEVGEYSDAATPEPLDDGTMGYRPRIAIACTRRLIVPAGATDITIDVTYHGPRCEVAIR